MSIALSPVLNFGLSENCWKTLFLSENLCRKLLLKNAKYVAEKSPFWRDPGAEFRLISSVRKFAAVYWKIATLASTKLLEVFT